MLVLLALVFTAKLRKEEKKEEGAKKETDVSHGGWCCKSKSQKTEGRMSYMSIDSHHDCTGGEKYEITASKPCHS